jgi:hypothetical protein
LVTVDCLLFSWLEGVLRCGMDAAVTNNNEVLRLFVLRLYLLAVGMAQNS